MHFGSSNSSTIGGGGGTGVPVTSTDGVGTGCDISFGGGGGALGTLSFEVLLDMLCIEEDPLMPAGAVGGALCSMTAR